MNDFNFISKNVEYDDLDLFFGPLTDETFIQIEDHWTMANIMKEAKIFPSTTQARKNGWNKDIPSGFSFYEVGKNRNKKLVYILNIGETYED